MSPGSKCMSGGTTVPQRYIKEEAVGLVRRSSGEASGGSSSGGGIRCYSRRDAVAVLPVPPPQHIHNDLLTR
nr:unnamed protein product [Callosobruchus analis]